ncbi:unnamed protein product [Amoebophrya sp. A120]|nr:unnamed protein product [Amoebophrya sp. A120]|eukprot:GSA120T00006629001.1
MKALHLLGSTLLIWEFQGQRSAFAAKLRVRRNAKASLSSQLKNNYGAIMTSYVEQLNSGVVQDCSKESSTALVSPTIEGQTQLNLVTGATPIEQVNRCGEYCSQVSDQVCGGFVYFYADDSGGANVRGDCVFLPPFDPANCEESGDKSRGSFRRTSSIVTSSTTDDISR